jgi:hypothetical protein
LREEKRGNREEILIGTLGSRRFMLQSVYGHDFESRAFCVHTKLVFYFEHGRRHAKKSHSVRHFTKVRREGIEGKERSEREGGRERERRDVNWMTDI